MKRTLITIIGFLLLFSILITPASAQDYTGVYGVEQDGETIILKLSQAANGIIAGTMTAEGIDYAVRGQLQGRGISGFMQAYDESLSFQAQLRENKDLVLTLREAQTLPGGYSEAETLVLRRIQAGKTGPSHTPPTASKPPVKANTGTNKVIINGMTLSQEMIKELERFYGIRPRPGNYWYDQRSGLYGVVGHPAFGFMRAGHNLGKLARTASAGNTGVLVNGRELPQAEWAVWSQLLGYMIQPGSYWLDENGNAGYEGNPIPTENLYTAAQRNAYRGSGRGGDNFWSTRFSAGNYDSGNQRGYVSVPGHGPIGYGF
jgi:hypothetical protein